MFVLPNNKRLLERKREISSAGSEHLPYKQGVTGSNPVSPTNGKPYRNVRLFLLIRFYIALRFGFIFLLFNMFLFYIHQNEMLIIQDI